MSRLAKAASDVDYHAYSPTESAMPASKSATVASQGDRKLAHSAQMFHYEHQKQQMLQLERSVNVTSFSPSFPNPNTESDPTLTPLTLRLMPHLPFYRATLSRNFIE